MFDFDTCTKDTLAEYAESKGLKLDMRKTLENLISEVKDAEISGELNIESNQPTKPLFLKNTVNGRVFEYTEALLAYGLIPCDKDGKSV